MKFCGNCGTQLDDDAVFCSNCGARVEDVAQGDAQTDAGVGQSNDQPGSNGQSGPYANPYAGQSAGNGSRTQTGQYSQPDGNGYAQGNGYTGATAAPRRPAGFGTGFSPKRIEILIALAVVVVIAIVAFVNRKTTIDLNKYTKITYTGYDTAGTAQYDFDLDQIVDDYGNKIRLKNTSDLQKEFLLDNALENVDVELSKESGISNGDKITLKWKISKDVQDEFDDMNVKLKYSDMTEKASGLKKVKTKDVFKNVKVTFSGANGHGQAKFKYDGSDDFPLAFIDDDGNTGSIFYNVSNGNKVTLTITADPTEFVKTYGYLPKEMKKTYKVEGLGKYATKLSDLSDDNIKQLTDDATNYVNQFFKEDSHMDDTDSLNGLKYIGTYFFDPKSDDTSENSAVVVLQGTLSSSVGQYADTVVYFPVVYDRVTYGKTVSFDDNKMIAGSSSISTGGGFLSNIPIMGCTDTEDMYNEVVIYHGYKYASYEMTDGLKQFGE